MIRRFFITVLALFVSLSSADSWALTDPGSAIQEQEIGFFTKLGETIDGSLVFTDEQGLPVTLASLLQPGVPTIVTPVYYGCPRLCGFLMNGVVELVKQLRLTMGAEYRIITVSFDPSESFELARGKSASVFDEIRRPDVNAANWRFLVGGADSVSKLMNQLGFRYKKDGEEYAHASGILVLTPQGEISQYFTGIEFSPWDVRLSLIEASKGSVGSAIDHILLFCYRFDPTKGKYTWVAFNVLRGGVLMAVLLFGALVFAFSRKVKRA